MKLDAEEREILASVERSEWRPVKGKSGSSFDILAETTGAGSADKCGVRAIESRIAGRPQDSPARSGIPGSPLLGELGRRSDG
jgi:hypothetical protein